LISAASVELTHLTRIFVKGYFGTISARRVIDRNAPFARGLA